MGESIVQPLTPKQDSEQLILEDISSLESTKVAYDSPVSSLSDADWHDLMIFLNVSDFPRSSKDSKHNFGGVDGHQLDIFLDHSYTDRRKMILLRLTLAAHGVSQPLDEGGGWMRALSHVHTMDLNDLIEIKALVEVEALLWSTYPASEVYSSSSTWPDMTIESGTQKELSMTPEDFVSGRVISMTWGGTTAYNVPLDGATVRGAVALREIFQDGTFDGSKEVFQVTATPSDPDRGQPIIAHGNRSYPFPDCGCT